MTNQNRRAFIDRNENRIALASITTALILLAALTVIETLMIPQAQAAPLQLTDAAEGNPQYPKYTEIYTMRCVESHDNTIWSSIVTFAVVVDINRIPQTGTIASKEVGRCQDGSVGMETAKTKGGVALNVFTYRVGGDVDCKLKSFTGKVYFDASTHSPVGGELTTSTGTAACSPYSR